VDRLTPRGPCLRGRVGPRDLAAPATLLALLWLAVLRRPRKRLRIRVGPRNLFASAALLVRLRLRSARCGLVYCDGLWPVVHGGGRIALGKRFRVRGRSTRVEFGAIRGGELLIGDNVFINQGTLVVSEKRIVIGSDSLISGHVTIMDTNSHELEEEAGVKTEPVLIGRNVWIGCNVVILPGAVIGDHSVIAAGSVVHGTIPPRVLAAGNPARVLREIGALDGWRRR
jgi:acetyltransferase-like isoleucine patch superfamily enzyme